MQTKHYLKGLYASVREYRRNSQTLGQMIRAHYRRTQPVTWRVAARKELRVASRRLAKRARARRDAMEGHFHPDTYGYPRILFANLITELTMLDITGVHPTKIRLTEGELGVLRMVVRLGDYEHNEQTGIDYLWNLEVVLADELDEEHGRFWVDDDDDEV